MTGLADANIRAVIALALVAIVGLLAYLALFKDRTSPSIAPQKRKGPAG